VAVETVVAVAIDRLADRRHGVAVDAMAANESESVRVETWREFL